jgi:integrase
LNLNGEAYMQLDMRATLESDTKKGRRVDGKEIMARRRYQDGCLFVRGRVGRRVWVARWREEVIRPDGAIASMMRSQVLGSVSSIPTRSEARKLLSSLLRPTNYGIRKPQATMTFEDFIRKWEEAVLPTYRVSPCNFYKDILRKHLAPKFASYRLCDIHTPDVQIFLNQKAESYSSAVLHHLRATLSRTFASAKEWGYVELNPVLDVRLPPKRNVRPKITLEPSGITQILEVVKERHRTMIFLAAVTGMRASEMLGLQWSDVEFDRRLLFVRRTYYRGALGLPKNNASERVIPLSAGLLGALYAHKQHVQCSSMDLIFPNAVGKPYEPNNLLKRVLHAALSSLGLPKTGWRLFRRTVATALSEMREPVRTAQQVLGHSSAQTTLAYCVQSVEESQRSAITRLEKIMFPSLK